jgi:hypothetical protein
VSKLRGGADERVASRQPRLRGSREREEAQGLPRGSPATRARLLGVRRDVRGTAGPLHLRAAAVQRREVSASPSPIGRREATLGDLWQSIWLQTAQGGRRLGDVLELTFTLKGSRQKEVEMPRPRRAASSRAASPRAADDVDDSPPEDDKPPPEKPPRREATPAPSGPNISNTASINTTGATTTTGGNMPDASSPPYPPYPPFPPFPAYAPPPPYPPFPPYPPSIIVLPAGAPAAAPAAAPQTSVSQPQPQPQPQQPGTKPPEGGKDPLGSLLETGLGIVKGWLGL